MPKYQRQAEIFRASEGNRYFERNRKELARSNALEFYAAFLRPCYRILEIGCSSGSSLDWFSRRVRCDCFGVDPSSKAVKFGKKNFPSLKLSIGTADDLDYPDEYFDFVLFGFCLYLVDRRNLAKVVSEADRVLKDKSFLGITDFDSKFPKKRPYKHRSGIFSYKMDYSLVFSAYPQYSLIEKHSFSHGSHSFNDDVTKRISTVMMFKDHGSAYFPEADV